MQNHKDLELLVMSAKIIQVEGLLPGALMSLKVLSTVSKTKWLFRDRRWFKKGANRKCILKS